MWKSIILGGLLLAVAVGGPISFFKIGDLWRNLKHKTLGSAATADVQDASAPAAAGISPTGAAAPQLAIEGAPVAHLAEVFRFDVSPTWVLQRWPRVSTDLTLLELHGYRVPLVTGTKLTDLAGALTYYFHPGQQVARITFRGTTGDPRALIFLLTKHYRYVRRPNNDPGRLVYESVDGGGQSAGQVIIHSAPVVRADRPLARFSVDLQMQRPEG